MSARTPTELMHLYWAECAKRGEKPKPVHALVALAGASQPLGHCIAWGVLRRYVENRQAALGDSDKWQIVEMAPEAQA